MIAEIIKPTEETACACFRAISPNYIHYTGEYDNFTVECDTVTIDPFTNDALISLHDGPVRIKIYLHSAEYKKILTRKWGM